MGLLSDIRVLELSELPTMLAGRILGDLGADVVTVEPPAGAPGRRCEPFAADIPGLERSLTWQALNYNKRGMTLDGLHQDGSKLLEMLVARFDVVLEATTPGQASPLQSVTIPQHIIHARVRPFSESGPKSAYKATDMILMAAGGAPTLAGDNDRAPLFFPVPQAMMEAGAETAVAVLGALVARDRDGLGQSVEVSARIAAMAGALGRIVAGFSGDVPTKRPPPSGPASSPLTMNNFECADGYVVLHLSFAGHFAAMTRKLIGWVRASGEISEELAATDWSQYGPGRTGAPKEPLQQLLAGIKRLCSRLAKIEIAEAARIQGFMAAPVMTMQDIAGFHHFRERGLFVPTRAAPHGQSVDIPARFVQLSDEPIEVRCPAPALSEHTAELMQHELGLSLQEIQALYVHGVI